MAAAAAAALRDRRRTALAGMRYLLEQVTAPPWLRVQALMVMCASVPQRMVELLPRLLALAGNEMVLIDQMLLDCCRLLLRSPGDMPIDMARLRRNLLDAVTSWRSSGPSRTPRRRGPPSCRPEPADHCRLPRSQQAP